MRVLIAAVLFTQALWVRGGAPSLQRNPVPGVSREQRNSGYSPWKNGLPTDKAFFPIAVWLQNPSNAARFRQAGINVYVGLWRGPTTNQLAELKAAGMRLICSQNRVALDHLDSPVIVGWMHGDEPDNAQSLGPGKGYGPPIAPERICQDYDRLRAADPTRPILLNLGQGVAWDNWIGRGIRRNHPEDYPEYVKGCDIASFDIYPVVHDAPEVTGKLEFVGRGVERLVNWTRGEKIVWNCVECTHISNPKAKATPEQVRAQVWMALIHGSRGLIYFVHQFKPTFKEAALLEDSLMLAAVTAINRQVSALAPVLNSPDVLDGVQLTINGSAPLDSTLFAAPTSEGRTRPIAWMQKRVGDSTYLLTVNMRNEPARVSFSLVGLSSDTTAEVLDEQRRIVVQNRTFTDEFKPYEVHLYNLR